MERYLVIAPLLLIGQPVIAVWIVAVLANITALLVHLNWNGFGLSQEIWTITMILTGTLLVSLAILQFKNPFLGLSVI